MVVVVDMDWRGGGGGLALAVTRGDLVTLHVMMPARDSARRSGAMRCVKHDTYTMDGCVFVGAVVCECMPFNTILYKHTYICIYTAKPTKYTHAHACPYTLCQSEQHIYLYC